MKTLLAFILLTLIFISACSSGISKHQKRSKKYSSQVKENSLQLQPHTKLDKRKPKKYRKHKKRTKKHKRQFKKYKRQSKKYKEQSKKFPLFSSSGPMLLPTVIHKVDSTLMVLINPLVDKTYQSKSQQRNLESPIDLSINQKKMHIFYIDHTEVTTEQYKKTHPSHNPISINGEICLLCPAMSVDWISAKKHCQTVGKRLPTEAEWELAALGSPWNKGIKKFANLIGDNDGFSAVAPVGSFPAGAGSYGVLDMIGNVWEWVDTPHSPLPKKSKLHENKNYKIVKGGGWTSPSSFASIDYRNIVARDIKNPTFGFRCAKSPS